MHKYFIKFSLFLMILNGVVHGVERHSIYAISQEDRPLEPPRVDEPEHGEDDDIIIDARSVIDARNSLTQFLENIQRHERRIQRIEHCLKITALSLVLIHAVMRVAYDAQLS